MVDAPGTVSRILWHFTGGPRWNEQRKKQNKAPKPAAEAYAALISIIQSRVLRLGSYKEIVRVRLPRVRRYDLRSKQMVTDENVMKELVSSPICSLADIPIPHLPYHAKRYGKFAIGFHRDAAIRHGFNPVFYTLIGTGVLRSLYEGFAQISEADLTSIQNAVDDVESEISGAECIHGHPAELAVSDSLSEIELDGDSLERSIDAARDGYADFLAYVKTFERSQFAEIYTEREWRATKPFHFSLEDIAMVVLPRGQEENEFFERFTNHDSRQMRLPRSIPIVPWEDLLEY